MGLSSILQVRRRTTTDKFPRTPSPASPVATKYENGRDTEQSTPSPTDNQHPNVGEAEIKQATRVRKGLAVSASIAYLISFVFLVLVMIGNTYSRPVLDSIYFFKLDLADIIPTSVPNAELINSIAQSIGLHDFYQVGLWNFCEGYEGLGITYCSKPKTLYWFNPVEIIMSELLSGATIALPTTVITILDVLRIISEIMFGFFFTGTILTVLLIPLSPLAIGSRWWSLPLGITAFLASALVGIGSILGTAISIAFKYAAEAQSDLNIHVHIGTKMFVFMWIAAGFTLYGFAVHAGMGCCCASRRDLRTGRRNIRGRI